MRSLDIVDEDRAYAIKRRVLELLKIMFKLDDVVVSRIDGGSNLFDQAGIDSLQAFDAIITLHDIIEEDVPRDIEPSMIATLDGLAQYLDTRYPGDCLRLLFEKDIAQLLAERAESADSL